MELSIFNDLEYYRLKGEYKTGLEIIERNSKRVENLDEQIQFLIVKARYLEGLSEYKQCLELCNDLLSKIDLNVEYEKYRGSINNLKGYCYFIMINLDQSLEIVSEAQKVNIEFDNRIEIVRSLNYQAEIYYYQDKLELALQSAEDAEKLSREIMDLEGQAKSLRWIGGYFHRIGKYKQALEFFEKSQLQFEKEGNQQGIADIMVAFGYTYWRIGELKVALEYASNSCTTSEQIKYQRGIADALSLIGNIYNSKGDIIKHRHITDRLLSISEYLNYQSMIADCYFHLGTINSFKGELDNALEYYKKSQLIYENYGGLSMVSLVSNNIGEVFFEKNELDLAFDSFQRALKSAEEINSLMLKSLALHSICANNLDENSSYKTIFQNLYRENQDNNVVLTLWNFQKAIELKSEKRHRSQSEAAIIFKSIVEDPPPSLPMITIQATVYCVELLLDEFKTYGTNEILEEIEEYLNILSDLGEKGNIYAVAYSNLLKAQMHLLKNNFEESKQLLSTTQLKAEEMGFKKLAIKASNEFDGVLRMEEEYTKRKENQNTRDIITNLEETIRNMQKKQFVVVQEVEEEPILFMIISGNGFSIYHHSFKKKFSTNENLLAMFLTAVNNFSKDALGTDQPMQRIVNGDYTIALEQAGYLTCCYVFQGPSYTAMKKLEKIVEKIRYGQIFPIDEESVVMVDNSKKSIMDQLIKAEIGDISGKNG